MKRFIGTLRSVVPQNPIQLIFIIGAVCLFIGALLPWGRRLGMHIPPLLNPLLIQPLGLWIILFSGAAAFFLFFRPGVHAARSLLLAVCLPALLGLAVEFGFYLYGAMVLSASQNGSPSIAAVLTRIARIAVGFHYTLVGFFLVALFTLCARLGFASLPLALPRSEFPSRDVVPWDRLCVLIWVLITWFPSLWGASLVWRGMDLVPGVTTLSRNVWIAAALSRLLPFGICLVLAASLLGKEVWSTFRRSVKLPPKPEMFLVALTLSAGVVLAAVAMEHYVFQRDYLSNNSFTRAFGFLFFVAAFCEEVIFRGLLQSWFISRYGILRGILLVGVVWAAMHMWSDFSSINTDANALLQVSGRLLGCVGGGMALGWLALKSRSIWPGVLAHWVYNCLVASIAPPFPGYYFVFLVIVVAYVLCRRWPIDGESSIALQAESALERKETTFDP